MNELLVYYLELWDLSEPTLLAKTPTSHVYRVHCMHGMGVLKLLTPLGVKDEAGGMVALHHFEGEGAVRLYDGDKQAHLLEYVGGNDLTTLVKNGQDEQATIIIGNVLNKLHAVSPKQGKDQLHSLRRWFHELFTKAQHDKTAGIDSVYQRGAAIAEELLANPQDECVLHGDIHHQNIRNHPTRGWLAFDPKGLYGERTYDAANTLSNPVNMPHLVLNENRMLHNIGLLSEILKIDRGRLIQFVFAYICLSAAWAVNDEQDTQLALDFLQILEPHMISLCQS